MARLLSPPPDAQRMLFQSLDISRTVRMIEARYSSSGRGRSRYPVRAMLEVDQEALIHLRVWRGFIVEGDPELVGLYHQRMMMEHYLDSHGEAKERPVEVSVPRGVSGSAARNAMDRKIRPC